MKKVFFAFVAAAVVVLTACNQPAADENATTTDTVAVENTVDNTAPAVTDTAAVTTDTTTAQ